MERSIILEFPLREAELESAGAASSKLKQMLVKMGIDEEARRRIVKSAYEAAINVVIHACRGVVRAEIFKDHTEICVRDEGPGISDLNLAMTPGYSTASEEARNAGFGGGQGLYNLSQFPDECTIRTVPGVGTEIHLLVRH